MAEFNCNDQFNADELEAPEWLNVQFITEVLSDYEKDSRLEVLGLEFSPASGKGDHYASVMFRAAVEYKTGKGKLSKSLIIKTMPEQEGHKKDMLNNSNIFQTEIGMYNEVLPKFEKILQEVGDKTKLFVPCLYYSMEPHQVLIFDDLIPLGYTVMRDREPNVEELQCSLSKLAKWHAVSMKVLNEDPKFLQEYKHGLCDMSQFLNQPLFSSGIPNFLQFLDTQPQLAKYVPYFKKVKENYVERLGAFMSEYRRNRREDGLYVLCHGDYHQKNMLFKHNKDTAKLEDCMLVDFQVCNLAPIAVDLVYGSYLLIGTEDRLNNLENILNYYFTILEETLKKISYKGTLPTLDRFWKQIHQARYYDFFLICSFLPMKWAMKTNSVDFIGIIENNEERLKCFQIQGYVDEVSKLLPRFEALGYFENL